MHLVRRICVSALLLLFAFTPVAFAQGRSDVFHWGRDITIREGESAQDVTCMFCSIFVRGQVGGDVAAFGGRVVVEGTVQGDVSAFGGDLRLAGSGKVNGDVAVFGGRLARDPQGSVGGEIAVFEGKVWLLLIFGLPLVLLAGLAWLIAWLLQRSRRPAAIPARAR